MDKTVLILGAAIFMVSLYFETVFCLNKNEVSVDNKVRPTLFNAQLGRRKRSYIEDGYDFMDENNFPMEYDKSQDMLIIIKPKEPLTFKNFPGKREAYIVRSGRNINNDLSTANKWLQDGDNENEYMIQRSPPFAPRLGRTAVHHFVRSGRDV